MNFYNISNIQSSLFLCPGKHFRYAATIEPSDLTSRVSSKPWKRNNLLYVQWSSKSLVQMLTFSFWQIFQILSCLSSTCDEKLLVGGGSGAAQRLREADEVRHLLHRQGAGHHRPALLLRRGLHPAGQDPGSREAGCGQDYRWVPEEYCIVLYIVLSKFDNEQSDLVHRWDSL